VVVRVQVRALAVLIVGVVVIVVAVIADKPPRF
jgi:hypothetical protein